MNILETLQRIAATTQRLDMALAEIERQRAERQRFEDAITARMERQEAQLADIRERLTRLERLVKPIAHRWRRSWHGSRLRLSGQSCG
jgi:hypothetical protein